MLWCESHRRVHKRLDERSINRLSSYHITGPIVSSLLSCEKRSNGKVSDGINWDTKMFLIEASKSLLKAKRSPEYLTILCAIFRGWSSVSNISLRCALLLCCSNMSKVSFDFGNDFGSSECRWQGNTQGDCRGRFFKSISTPLNCEEGFPSQILMRSWNQFKYFEQLDPTAERVYPTH